MVEIGTISHGSLRPEDLAAAHVEAAGAAGVALSGDLGGSLAMIQAGVEIEDWPEVLDAVADAVNAAVLDQGVYFGALEGDPSDIGFWPVEDA